MAINTTFAAGGTLDTIVNSMLDKSRRKLIMASVKSNALVAWAMATDKVELENGGANITNPLTIGRNPNVASYQYYDELPVAQTNEFTTIGYGWSRIAGTMIISDQEVDENTGEAALFKILQGKLDVLEESMGEKFSEYLYGAGGGTDPLGLAALIADDPTAGTLGGLSRVTEQQWRTSAYQFGGNLDPTNIEEAFDDVLLDLKLKGDKPDLILVGRNILRTYRQAVRDKIMITLDQSSKGKGMFDLGFEGVTHNGIPMLYDEDCGVNRAYFINSKYLRTHILKGVNMRRKDLNAPWTIDGMGKRVVWQGNFCNWRCFRTHAVLRNGTTG
jgi:hypothetical protein